VSRVFARMLPAVRGGSGPEHAVRACTGEATADRRRSHHRAEPRRPRPRSVNGGRNRPHTKGYAAA